MEGIPGDIRHNGFGEPQTVSKSAYRTQRALAVFNFILAVLLIAAGLAFYEHWLYQREYRTLVKLWNQSQVNQNVLNKFSYNMRAPFRLSSEKKLLISKADESEYRFKTHLSKLEAISILPRHPELKSIHNSMIEYDKDSLALIRIKKDYIYEAQANGRDDKRLSQMKKLNLVIIPRERRTAEKIWHVSSKNYNPVDGFFNYLQIAAGIKF